jgi:hypothetical protein
MHDPDPAEVVRQFSAIPPWLAAALDADQVMMALNRHVPQSARTLWLAVSEIIFARNADNRLSISASISRKVAFGCPPRHSAIPSTISSLNPFHSFCNLSPFMIASFRLVLLPILPPFPKKYSTPPSLEIIAIFIKVFYNILSNIKGIKRHHSA